MTMLYNPELMKTAVWYLQQQKDKQAFVPAMDPSAGAGGPPGMPPGAQPGAMPPGAPPGADPAASGQPDVAGMIQQSVQQAVQQNMGQGMGQPGAAGAGPGMKPAKPDINTVAMDVWQIKKLLTHLFNTQGMQLPPDIIDGPNRDPSTGAPMPMGAPGSTSDPQAMQQAAQRAIPQGGPPQAGPPQGMPPKMSSSIGSIYEPETDNVANKIAALANIMRVVRQSV